MDFPRTLIIGLDGATFDVIKPWSEAGLLPTFAHLLKHGAHATLDAFPSASSAPAWSNIVTGYNPGQHAVYGFTNQSNGARAWHPTTALDRQKPAFWQLLAASGQRVGVMNVPISYPANATNGFMVSGMDSPDTNLKGFTQPEGLAQELHRNGIDYVIDVPNIGKIAQAGASHLPSIVRDMTVARTRAFLYLLDKYPCDAAMLVYIATDRMSHYFWRETPPLPDAPEWQPLIELYQLYDAQIQELLSHAGKDTTVFILSDHGFGSARRGTSALSPMLQQLGYQKSRSRPSPKNISGALLRLGRRTIPLRFQRQLAARFPRFHSRAARSDKQSAYDWAQTRAYAYYGGAVRINSIQDSPNGIVTADEYDALRAELRDVMQGLTDPDSGAPVVSSVHDRETLYQGPCAGDASDLYARWNFDHLRHALAYRQNGHAIVVRPPVPANQWIGAHRPEGIFIAYGKGIRPGITHHTVRHFDLTPTVLFLHDKPIAQDMDGHVLSDWFDAEMSDKHSIKTTAASAYTPRTEALNDAENALIEDRLQNLGYIE